MPLDGSGVRAPMRQLSGLSTLRATTLNVVRIALHIRSLSFSSHPANTARPGTLCHRSLYTTLRFRVSRAQDSLLDALIRP